jgi:hypothetical protein
VCPEQNDKDFLYIRNFPALCAEKTRVWYIIISKNEPLGTFSGKIWTHTSGKFFSNPWHIVRCSKLPYFDPALKFCVPVRQMTKKNTIQFVSKVHQLEHLYEQKMKLHKSFFQKHFKKTIIGFWRSYIEKFWIIPKKLFFDPETLYVVQNIFPFFFVSFEVNIFLTIIHSLPIIDFKFLASLLVV